MCLIVVRGWNGFHVKQEFGSDLQPPPPTHTHTYRAKKDDKFRSKKSTDLLGKNAASSVKSRFGVTYRFPLQGRRNRREAGIKQSLALKMEAICSSEASVGFERITRRCTLHNHRCENLKPYSLGLLSLRCFNLYNEGKQKV
jgi:hypothetical protein